MLTKPRDTRVLFAAVAVLTAAVAVHPAAAGPAVQDGPEVTLESETVVQQRGDVVALTLDFDRGASVAQVTLGSADVSFQVRFVVWDRDGDGSATVLWNTARSTESDAGLSVAAGDGERPDLFIREPTILDGVSGPVEPAEYPVTVVTADTGEETDLGSVVVEERASEALTAHTAPAAAGPFDSAGAVADAASGAEAGGTIAVGEDASDWVVLRLSASGLSGVVDDAADLDDPADGVSLTLVEREASVGANEERVEVRLDGNATLFQAEDDVYLLAIDAAALLAAGAEVGDEFVANVTVTTDHAGTETTESLSTTFALVEGRGSFDLQDGEFAVEAAEDARVTGTATWAPGTELIVALYAAGEAGTPAVSVQTETVVGPDGTWDATLDLSEASRGQQVTARLFHGEAGSRLAVAEGELR